MAKKPVSKKKITAPATYKPSGGRPREYLAYLNQREMDYLRSINGNNMERGPKGLPSFPPDDAIGSSSKASSGTGARGPTGPGGQARSSPAGDAGGKPGSVSRSPSTGAGSGQGGQKASTASRDLGIAGVPGGVSRTGGALAQAGKPTGGGGQGPSNSLNAPARTAPSAPARAPASPMGGQGTSFKSPAAAGQYNADRVAQQTGQIKDAIKGVQNAPSVNKDLSAGGIKTLNVGPMGTPVNVQSIAKLSPMEREPSLADRAMTAAGSIAGSISQAVSGGINSLFGGQPTKAEGPLGEGAYERVPTSEETAVPKYAGPLGQYAYDRVPAEVDQTPVDKGIVDRLKEQYSMYNNPNAGVTAPSSGYKYNEPIGPRQPGSLSMGDIAARNARMNELAEAPDEAFQGYENYDPLGSLRVNTPLNRAVSQPDYRPYDIRVPQERILEVEDVPPEKPRTYSGILPGSGPKRRASETVYTPGDYEAYRAAGAADPNFTYDAENSFRDVEAVDSPYISPVQQMPAYPEKTFVQKQIAERIPYAKYGVKLATLAGRKEFESLTPQEQANLMERWATTDRQALRSAGQGSQKELPNLPRGYGGGNGMYVTDLSGGTSSPTPTIGGPRPEIYFSWDIGANIPSPDSPDYTLYLKYLNEKAAAQSALGIG